MPTDYLAHTRPFYKPQGLTDDELQEEREQLLCKTCTHYDFYHCKALNCGTAPKAQCKSPDDYAPLNIFD